jgi:histidinol phosphatase-like enzyme
MTHLRLAIINKEALTASRSGSKFVSSPEDQIIKLGADKLVKCLLERGYEIWIASNQGEVAVGHEKNLEDAIAEMLFCNKLFCEKVGEHCFDAFLFCPDLEGNDCYFAEPHGANDWARQILNIGKTSGSSLRGKFRKPHPGMLLFAKEYVLKCSSYDLDLKLEDFLLIGDQEEDELAAIAAGARFVSIEEAIQKASKTT